MLRNYLRSGDGPAQRRLLPDGSPGDGRGVSLSAVPGKHGAQRIQRWSAKEGRAPVAVSFGHDPLLLAVGGTEVPAGIFELEYAGAIVGERVPVIHGEVTNLPIPAGAEIAIEGWLRPDLVRDEGPFGEWTGYYSGTRRPCLAIDIERLYYRDDPICWARRPASRRMTTPTCGRS